MAAAIGRTGGGATHEHEAAAQQMRDQPLGDQTGHELVGIVDTPPAVIVQPMLQGAGNSLRPLGTDDTMQHTAEPELTRGSIGEQGCHLDRDGAIEQNDRAGSDVQMVLPFDRSRKAEMP